ncbi:hypothetical protein FM106_22485 [Brachybacterium faecium]|nr:hypothetical protein FM106_22485 [Brachybacterium faecium]
MRETRKNNITSQNTNIYKYQLTKNNIFDCFTSKCQQYRFIHSECFTINFFITVNNICQFWD